MLKSKTKQINVFIKKQAEQTNYPTSQSIRLTHLQIQHIDDMSISINIQGHNTSSIPDNPRQFIFKSPNTHQLSQLIYEVNINESSLSQVSTDNVRKSKDESTHDRESRTHHLQHWSEQTLQAKYRLPCI